jgi:ribosomal protein L32
MPVLALALGVNSSAAVLRPAGSPFMPLRCSHQAPGLRTEEGVQQRLIAHHVCKSWQAVYSAQRHKGGVGGPRPPRRTAAQLSTPPTRSCTKLQEYKTKKTSQPQGTLRTF